jgi:hypothetical protein
MTNFPEKSVDIGLSVATKGEPIGTSGPKIDQN